MKRVVIAAALLTICCGSGNSGEEVRGVAIDRVIGGTSSPDADDGVLILRTDRVKDTSVCSASLIAPNLLLTARHCIVAEYPADNIRCNADGTAMAPSGGQLGASVSPEYIHIFSGQQLQYEATSNLPSGEPAAIATQVVTTDWPSVCRDDIALIVLDRDLPLPVIPLALDTTVTRVTRVSVVGYGLTEDSNEADRWSARRRRDRIPVKYVDTLPNTFAVGRSVCKGDSGGPALDSESGAVLGVYSLGIPGETVADCTSQNALNYFAQVNRYPDLLRQGFEAAGRRFPADEPVGGVGGAPPEEVPVGGGQPNTGAGGAAAAGEGADLPMPTAVEATSAAGGCQVSTGTTSSAGWLLAVAGLTALKRRRTVSR